MNRFASTRSEKRARHPCFGRAQCSVGSIDDDGIRYGFTTHALIASTIATAPAMVTIQSIATRQPCGRFGNSRSTGLRARFEGFDERIVEHLATDAISIGPYVLSGGELPAMVLLDAIARRLPGAIKEESGAFESFSAELGGGLEYPHYTRPPEFRGWRVPDVLLSGNHARIAEWRREQSRARTAR